MKAITAVLLIMTACTAWAYDAPSDAQIEQLLANPGQMGTLLTGATTDEAAGVVQRAITAVENSNLDAAAKSQTVALLTARLVKILGANDAAGIKTLINAVDDQWKDEVAAAALLSTADEAAMRAALKDVKDLGPALTSPELWLGSSLANLVRQSAGRPVVAPTPPTPPASVQTPVSGSVPPTPPPMNIPGASPVGSPEPGPVQGGGGGTPRPSPPVPNVYRGQG